MVHLTVNGSPHSIDAPPDRTLLGALRDDLGLTGAKYGCGEGMCGACTVLVDGNPVRACMVRLDEVAEANITTVEGLAEGATLHPVQRAFVEARALQCGYCTPGMVMSAAVLLARDPEPDEDSIREALAGNVCRCGGYPRILRAVRAAARTSESPLAAIPEPADDTASPVLTSVLPNVDVEQTGWGWSTPGGARLEVLSDGRVRAYIGKVDAGQGNRFALIRLIAAELHVPTSKVELVMGDTAASPFDIGTFGSRSMPDAGHALRLVAAAACEAKEYADPTQPLMPRSPTLDAVDDAAVQRGLVNAVTGAKRFPSDIRVPGMLHGRVLRPPSYGAVLEHVDLHDAQRLPDVTIVQDGDFVGVVAPDEESASQALHAVSATWRHVDAPDEGDLEHHLRAHPVASRGWGGPVTHEEGDVGRARAEADVVLDATYTTAYIAHVPLETRSALATFAGDDLTVWTGTQRPFGVRSEVATTLGLPEERVRIIVPDFGGGFGGKHTGEAALEAARLARAANAPVRVAWTREEEFRYGYFRPAAVIDVRSSATADGTLTSWEFTNINSGAAALFSPYAVANQRVRFQPADSPLPQGSYRALAATANNFARESHIDELASALGIDAVELRLRHLQDDRLADVLQTLAERVGWPRAGVGIACGVEKDTRVATAVDVARGDHGELKMSRIVTVVDCGAVVDPDGLNAQVVGATIMGLGGALFEAVHFDAGRVTNASLTDYRVPRFSDVPPIEVILRDRPNITPAGAGETPIIAVAPAIANAIRSLTGRRIRALPLLS